MSVTVTCDRGKNDALRVAVWQGKVLQDLYVDSAVRLELTGAVAIGKVARVMPGERVYYIDCDLDEKVRIVSDGKLRAGQKIAVRITQAARQGKAFGGSRVADVAVNDEALGVIEPPPTAWQRVLRSKDATKIKSIIFGDRDDFAVCQEWLGENSEKVELAQLSTAPVHPMLDELIDGLTQPQVALSSGAAMMIETTEALTAIDVNGPEEGNALAINLLAVKEAARQIRLRNIGGIIVIDILKMKERADKAKVLNALQRVVSDDVVPVQVFGLTKLGLIEIVRERQRPSLAEVLSEG